jgi:predicted DNA-binding ArsR family transcriptional regulator
MPSPGISNDGSSDSEGRPGVVECTWELVMNHLETDPVKENKQTSDIRRQKLLGDIEDLLNIIDAEFKQGERVTTCLIQVRRLLQQGNLSFYRL